MPCQSGLRRVCPHGPRERESEKIYTHKAVVCPTLVEATDKVVLANDVVGENPFPLVEIGVLAATLLVDSFTTGVVVVCCAGVVVVATGGATVTGVGVVDVGVVGAVVGVIEGLGVVIAVVG